MSVRNIKAFIESTYQTTPNEIMGYTLDTQLSTLHTKVYWNEMNKSGIIAERPTTDLRDVASDILVGIDFTGRFSSKIDNRFTTAYRTYKSVDQKYGLNNFIAIGYSLGSIVLERYPESYKFKEIFLISKPVAPSDIIKGTKPLQNATEIRSERDPTSLLKPLQKQAERTKVIKAETYNPKIEHQASEILQRLNPDEQLGDPNVLTGLGIHSLKNVEIKQLIKKLRKGKARKYPVTRKNKGQLLQMVIELLGEYHMNQQKAKVNILPPQPTKRVRKPLKRLIEEI